MKNFALFLISVLIFFGCKKSVDSAGSSAPSSTIVAESSVPASVISSFNSSFSTSTEREWHHTSDDNFICQFNMSSQRHQAEFDDKGHESSHSVICLDDTVPALVLNAFSTSFPGDIVFEWKFTTDNNWKAHFMRGSIKWEVTINNSGNIVKSEHD